jgi:hypothetical protein
MKRTKGGKGMKKKLGMGLFVTALAVLWAFPVLSAPPTNPNGFPSGTHYNLNIIGKKVGFNGCDIAIDPETNLPVYGGVVFTPQGSLEAPAGGDLLFRSGSGRKAFVIDGLDPSALQVTDPCVTAFDEDPAEIVLPPSANGYWVYARALGKLTDNPYMTIKPNLIQVSSADDTVTYLGLVTSDGFTRADGYTVTRKKGGKSNAAININDLFSWSGYVCYTVNPMTIGLTDDPSVYPFIDMCATDTSDPLDGVPDAIMEPADGECTDTSYTLTQLYCREYENEQWLFNIADFVDYFVDIDNNGAKLVQIRFYQK